MSTTTKIVLGIVVVTAIVLLGYWFWGAPAAPSPEGATLSPIAISQEVSTGQAVLLDVRTAEERAQDGYAAGSTHFDLARLQAGELPDFAIDTPIYAYCKGGTRAGIAKGILEEHGFTNVTNIGGLVDWEAAGGAVSR